MAMDKRTCVLMFSGGRDSSLAALRLAKIYSRVVLVTVTSDHLYGIETVHKRLGEIKKLMPASTEWCSVEQPASLLTDVTFYAPTCLPCHHSYVVVGSILADKVGAKDIAFGYVAYQGSWPEQTSYAAESLKGLLKEFDFDLILPVYEMNSLDDMRSELLKYGLSLSSLEQKCKRQVTNVELGSNILHAEIDRWIKAMRTTLRLRQKVILKVTKSIYLRDSLDI